MTGMSFEGVPRGGHALQPPLAVAELPAVPDPEHSDTRETCACCSLARGLPACSFPSPDRWQEITVALEQTRVMAVS